MSFIGWEKLGQPSGHQIKSIVVGQNGDGRLEIFARASDNGNTDSIWHMWQVVGGWSDWVSMGSPRGTGEGLFSMGVGLQQNQCIKFFTWPASRVQIAPNSGWSAEWQAFFKISSLNGLWGVLAATPGGEGRDPQEFGDKPNDPNQPPPSSDEAGDFGGGPGDDDQWIPVSTDNYYVVANEISGNMNVFGQFRNILVRIYQTDRSEENTHGWALIEELRDGRDLTGISQVADFDVGVNEDGRLEAFGRGLDGNLWHTWQPVLYSKFSAYAREDNPSPDVHLDGRPRVAQNQDGRLEVFCRFSDGALWHNWQTSPNNGWYGWDSLGGRLLSNLSAGITSDGRLFVVGVFLDGALWRIMQTAANADWTGWASLGGEGFSDVTLKSDADKRLQVFGVSSGSLFWRGLETIFTPGGERTV